MEHKKFRQKLLEELIGIGNFQASNQNQGSHQKGRPKNVWCILNVIFQVEEKELTGYFCDT